MAGAQAGPLCVVRVAAAAAAAAGRPAGGVSGRGKAAADRPLRRGAGPQSYQGVPGAYSEQASLTAYPDAELLPCPDFESAFTAVAEMAADHAVMPVENSLGGSIHDNYDLLMQYQLFIVGEVGVPVRHCLLALPGTKLEDVERAMSHPQALFQTTGYLGERGIRMEAVDDTAGAAQMIAEQGLERCAAVASSRAGELYGLEVLDRDIQDNKDNVTRFVKLAREPAVVNPGVPCKTSVVFALEEGPGQLFKALSVFAMRDIDLTKIESRPLTRAGGPRGANLLPESRGFAVLFYVDFEGSLATENAQNALRHLQEMTTFLRVLGSYERDLDRRER